MTAQTPSALSKPNRRRWTLLFICSALTFWSVFAEAQGGSNAGNGGDVIARNGRYYLLDLVEAGVAEQADAWVGRAIREFHPESLPIYNQYLVDYYGERQVRWAEEPELFRQRPQLRDALVATVSKFYGVNGAIVLGGAYSFAWKLTQEPLVNIGDEHTLIDTKLNPLIQVAVRRNRSIVINQKIFDQMDLGNQIALLLHEVFYAYLNAREFYGEKIQVSWDAREINGDFFRSLNPAGAPDFDLKNYNNENGNALSYASLLDLNGMWNSPVKLNSYSASQQTGMMFEFAPKLRFFADRKNSQDNLLPPMAAGPIEIWHFANVDRSNLLLTTRSRCRDFVYAGAKQVSMMVGTTSCRIRFVPINARNSEFKMLTLGSRDQVQNVVAGTTRVEEKEGCTESVGSSEYTVPQLTFKTVDECSEKLADAIITLNGKVRSAFSLKP